MRVIVGDSGLCCCVCLTSFECLLTPLRVDSAHENVDNKLSVCQHLSVMHTETSLPPQRHCLWDVQTAETSVLVRCADRDATACMMCRQCRHCLWDVMTLPVCCADSDDTACGMCRQ